MKISYPEKLFFLPLVCFTGLSLFFPFGTLIAWLVGPPYVGLWRCTAYVRSSIPLNVVFALIIVFHAIWPFIVFKTKSAIFVMLQAVFNWISIGLWFLSLCIYYVLCNLNHEPSTIIITALIATMLFAVLTFHSFVKPRLLKLLEVNKHVWDFERMKYSYRASILRPDGVSAGSVVRWVTIAGLAGTLIGRVSLPLIFPDPEIANYVDNLSMLMVGCLVAYFLIGFCAAGQLYLVVVVFRQQERAGKKMTVIEFEPIKRARLDK